ncbi:hypothetical protein [Haloarchaeobius sp. TZWWS8]|uniref:hypothetical protein n=1 Tax=Haloarchaeobius sp. TZWWS8 TaxID=3446121 RepID=UPI003EC0925D
MKHTAIRAALFALYQLSIALGIVLMPLALAMRRLGVSLPVGRLVESTAGAYERATVN